MALTHLALDGSWRRCNVGADKCALLLHLPEGITPEEAAQLPRLSVEQLMAMVQNPHVRATGRQEWSQLSPQPMRGKSKPVTRLHRDYDLPAVIEPDGTRIWYRNGRMHRFGDKPALIRPDGTMQWWLFGKKHRENGEPAILWASGAREWWVKGKEHRDGGLPAIDGTEDGRAYEAWYQYGKLHRDGDLPAEIDVSGAEAWWWHGIEHRVNGPAVVYRTKRGAKPHFYEWWLNGEQLQEADWKAAIRRMNEVFKG